MQLLKQIYWTIEMWLNRILTMRILPLLCFPFPVKKNKVVFINFNGRGYGCNPKYIAEEILGSGLHWDLVWLVDDLEEPLPKGIRKARFRKLTGIYEIATAKIIITNVKNDLCLIKKKRSVRYSDMAWFLWR